MNRSTLTERDTRHAEPELNRALASLHHQPMNAFSTDVVVILLLILVNGALSMAEFAIISSSPARLRELREAGYPSARLVLRLLDNASELLSSLKATITLVGITTGVLGGIFFSGPLAALFLHTTLPAPCHQPLALGIVIVALSFVSLVFGAMLPKKIALRHPETLALKLAGSVELLFRLTTPAVLLARASTRVVLKTLGIDTAEKPSVSDEDVMLMIRKGAKKGVFESVEYDMISRIFRMSDKRASAIMTPRGEIEWLDLELSEEELISRIKASGRSRFPVAEGSLDELLGVVRSLDLVNFRLSGNGSIKSAIRDSMKVPLFVPESVPAFQVLEIFKKNRAHMALIIDEHGSLQGAITLTDVLESIVGDVPADDPAIIDRRIVRRSQRTWIVDGMLPVDEFISSFELDADDFFDKNEPSYDTMSGFMMTRLGEVPSVSDVVRWNGLSFKVIKMNGKRVGRILVEQEAKRSGR